ncbi:MAG: hypothetical protein H6Q65_389 [Firmicutes bacterium]|nr:hypothetical protein [Bacillota bacterium]
MEFFKNTNFVVAGFLVWLFIAPRITSPRYRELFLAYMTALLICLIATSEIMTIKPVAFFFTVGGSFAFFYVLLRSRIRIKITRGGK